MNPGCRKPESHTSLSPSASRLLNFNRYTSESLSVSDGVVRKSQAIAAPVLAILPVAR